MNDQKLPLPPCPLCSVDGRYRQWRNLYGHGSHHLKVVSDAHTMFGSEVMTLVCTNCGNIQFFVDPNDFNRG
ncbi:hypothetical protein KDA_13630 [Dictyobacter alpinus]|uniref:Uncharacterized protein n=1 Tax=Dictyobacter alpinus TaxID=2014873 RepID=A0A402B3F0_9CHLR|nr:hypothetical protein [Dictyobacter alpinus]GCE25879.1 hypothetical protein KDA_13630 [Dictyobacter alpinus]